MAKRMTLVFAAGVSLLSLAMLGGCTRAKPEISPSKPTVPAANQTGVSTIAPVTATAVLAVQPSATPIASTAGPTTVGVAQATATVFAPTMPGAATAEPTSSPVPVVGQYEHTVQWGDTLYSIALRYNTTVDELAALNGIVDPSLIRIGQVLRVQGSVVPSPGPEVGYVVQAGDTLYSIARRYGTTVEAIQRANGLVNPWYIAIGQELLIPSGTGAGLPGATGSYVVQPGDTLYGIAAQLGKSAWELIVANNLSDPYWIYVGQVLVIPS